MEEHKNRFQYGDIAFHTLGLEPVFIINSSTIGSTPYWKVRSIIPGSGGKLGWNIWYARDKYLILLPLVWGFSDGI